MKKENDVKRRHDGVGMY